MRKMFLIMAVLVFMVSLAFAQTDIYDIQYVENPAEDDASPMVGDEVTIQGWVTFEPMSMGGNKFRVADSPGAWNGIYVYTGGVDYNLGFGWLVEVTGVVEEYFGITELNASEGTVEVLDDEVDWADLPAACDYTLVPVADLGSASTAEQYESVLVRVEDVTCSELPDENGEWVVTDGGNDLVVDNPSDDVYGYKHKPVVDLTYDYIQGVLNYSYSEYKLLPEIAHDLKVDEDPGNGVYTPFFYFQQVRPMDMTIRGEGADMYTWDFSYASADRYDDQGYEETITVHGLVSMPTGLSYAGAGVKFIMYDFDNAFDDDGNSEPWSAVLSYDPDATNFPNLFEGDEIEVTGYVSEYNTGASHMTELFITEPVQFLSAANPLPTPSVVTVPELRDPITAEQWGNVFVDVQNSVVIDNDQPFNELFIIDDDINDDIDGVIVDADSDSLDDGAYPTLPVGVLLESVTGWIYHHYGSYEDPNGDDWPYKLEPLYADDIVVGSGPPMFAGVIRNPGAPGANGGVTIEALIADDGAVTRAQVKFKIGFDGEWNTVDMDDIGGGNFEGEIEGYPEGTNIWYYLEAEDNDNNISTWPADPEYDLLGYWCTDDLGIYEVQYTPMPSGNSPYDGVFVTVTGVITTPPENAMAYGTTNEFSTYFMQTGNEAPFSGLCVNIPLDFDQPEVGDLVTVSGNISESDPDWGFKWGNNTKLINTVQVDIESSGNIWEAYDVTTADLNDNTEQYESVVVQVNNVTITELNTYDWSFTDDSGETFLLDDDMIIDEDLINWYGALTVGSTITYVRGAVTYSFGSWKIEPTTADDLGETAVGEAVAPVPASFALESVYPNPFNPSTSIRYSVDRPGVVQLIVYNSLGQRVSTLVDAPLTAGGHTAYWNGLSDAGLPVASGTYFVRLVSDSRQIVRKMVLMK